MNFTPFINKFYKFIFTRKIQAHLKIFGNILNCVLVSGFVMFRGAHALKTLEGKRQGFLIFDDVNAKKGKLCETQRRTGAFYKHAFETEQKFCR